MSRASSVTCALCVRGGVPVVGFSLPSEGMAVGMTHTLGTKKESEGIFKVGSPGRRQGIIEMKNLLSLPSMYGGYVIARALCC